MNLFWLLKMSQWVRHPPSWRKVLVVFAVIGICLALFAVEALGLWPDWARVNAMHGRRFY